MKRKDLNQIRFNVYSMWYECEDKKIKKQYKDMLQVIDYTIQLKQTIKNINKIGQGHL